MDDLKKIQNEIQKLAYERFRNIDCSEGFSYPLIPRISEEYLKNRVVVMGQETNTWKDFIDNPKKRENFIEGSLAEYDRFVRDQVANYPGKFWQFSRNLYGGKENKILDGHVCNGIWLSHCWMNFFCIEKCVCPNDKDPKNKPSQNRKLAYRVLEIQQDFVFQVLRLIRPRVILAMIGNKNDDLFKKFVLGTECVDEKPIDCAKTFGEWSTAEFKEFEVLDAMNPLYGTLILRTYHPSYFMGRMRGRNRKELYRNLIYEKISTFLKK